MIKNRNMETVNKDGKLLALFGGMLIDGLVIISLIVYVAIRLAS
jgi:hypothetical protein